MQFEKCIFSIYVKLVHLLKSTIVTYSKNVYVILYTMKMIDRIPCTDYPVSFNKKMC